VGIGLGPVRTVTRRAECRELRGPPRHRPGGGEELDVLRVGAGPAALDVGHAVLVEHPGDPDLVGERKDEPLALGPVSERRVVEDDRGADGAGVRLGHRAGPAMGSPSTGAPGTGEPRTGAPSRATIASAIPAVPTRSRPSSSRGMRSAVRTPSSRALLTADSIAAAA